MSSARCATPSCSRHSAITPRPTIAPIAEGSITEFRIEPSISTGDETLGFVRGTAEGRIYETFA